MKFYLLTLLVLGALGQSVNNGIWEECDVDLDCGNNTGFICDTYCVLENSYSLNLLRTVPQDDGGFYGLFYMSDSSNVVRSFNSTRLVDADEFEGYHEVSSSIADLVAYDVTILVDVSASVYNESSLTPLQAIVDDVAAEMFVDDESRAVYMSVYAFAGMEDVIELAAYKTSATDVAELLTEENFDFSKITDQSTNLYGAVFETVERVRLNADSAPNEWDDYAYIAQMVVIVSDGYDTAGRVGSSTAENAVSDLADSGFVFAVPEAFDEEYDEGTLEDISSHAIEYESLKNYTDDGGKVGTMLAEVFLYHFENAGSLYFCPEERSSFGSTGSVVLSDDAGASVTFSNLLILDQPQCANVWEGSVDPVYNAPESYRVECYDAGSDVYYICGMYQGIYCGTCGDQNPVIQLTSNSDSTNLRFSTDQESISLSFGSDGNEDMGVLVYAREGATPAASGNLYTFYAPESEVIETEDDCASCDEITYTWGQDCSGSVTLDIEGIKPTDEWYILVSGCGEEEDAGPASDIPVDNFLPTISQSTLSDDYIMSVSVSGSGVSGGVIAGAVIGGLVGAVVLGGACFWCIGKIRK